MSGGTVMGNGIAASDRMLSRASVSKLMGFQMRWAECLHGDGPLREPLVELADMFGARVVHLHRTCIHAGVQRTIASADLAAREGARPLTRAIGPELLTVRLSQVRIGSVWSFSELEEEGRGDIDGRSLRWMADRGIQDVIAIPLGGDGDSVDFLELYLASKLNRDLQVLLDCVASAAVSAWERRPSGRIGALLRATPSIAGRGGNGGAPGNLWPLSPSNPYDLTAAEMRICAMIRSGLSPADIMDRAGLAKSTVRTHLRNVYAKLRVTGQIGLVRLLLTEDRSADRASAG
jgi:DNA-binding CsgD family transcriptional regulator